MPDYPPNMTLRPIVAWPLAETRTRQRSNFSAPWQATLDLLDREIHYLGRGMSRPPTVLQIAMRERDFRVDGMPRANAVPAHPGVILNIESPTKGPLSFPCDKFDRWRDNLRAIALGLEALRKVDRYGITPGNEQYRGWQAIEAKPAPMTTFGAHHVIARAAGMTDDEAEGPEQIRLAYKRARANTHPDRGGERAAWDQVETAASVLRAAGWLS